MDSIWINAPAKINIGLDVIRRREDGYHEVKMIMQRSEERRVGKECRSRWSPYH